MEPLTWSAYEHQHLERGSDWYIALAIIAVCTALTAIIFNNFFFALLIILAAATLGLMASRPPELSTFTLNQKGLMVDDTFFPYYEMRAFWIQDEPERLLLVDTPRIMAPDVVIHIPEDIPLETVRAFFVEEVPEIPLQEPWAYKVLESFGF